jgi:hypothetical protein
MKAKMENRGWRMAVAAISDPALLLNRKRSADWQSAVSPNGIRQSFDLSEAGGLPIRDTADYQSALPRAAQRAVPTFCFGLTGFL